MVDNLIYLSQVSFNLFTAATTSAATSAAAITGGTAAAGTNVASIVGGLNAAKTAAWFPKLQTAMQGWKWASTPWGKGMISSLAGGIGAGVGGLIAGGPPEGSWGEPLGKGFGAENALGLMGRNFMDTFATAKTSDKLEAMKRLELEESIAESARNEWMSGIQDTISRSKELTDVNINDYIEDNFGYSPWKDYNLPTIR